MYELINNEGKRITVDKQTFEQVKRLFENGDCYSTFLWDVDSRAHIIVIQNQQPIFQPKTKN